MMISYGIMTYRRGKCNGELFLVMALSRSIRFNWYTAHSKLAMSQMDDINVHRARTS